MLVFVSAHFGPTESRMRMIYKLRFTNKFDKCKILNHFFYAALITNQFAVFCIYTVSCYFTVFCNFF